MCQRAPLIAAPPASWPLLCSIRVRLSFSRLKSTTVHPRMSHLLSLREEAATGLSRGRTAPLTSIRGSLRSHIRRTTANPLRRYDGGILFLAILSPHRERRSASCSTRSDYPAATTPFPWRDNTPWPRSPRFLLLTNDHTPLVCGDGSTGCRRSDDRVARQQRPSAPARHRTSPHRALARGIRRHRLPGSAKRRCGDENVRAARLIVLVAPLVELPPSSIVWARNRFSVQGFWDAKGEVLATLLNYQSNNSISSAIFSASRPRSLAKVLRPFKRRHPERWPDWLKAPRFESVCGGKPVPWVRNPLLRHQSACRGPDTWYSTYLDMGDNLVPEGLSRVGRVFWFCSRYEVSKIIVLKLTSQMPSSTSLDAEFFFRPARYRRLIRVRCRQSRPARR